MTDMIGLASTTIGDALFFRPTGLSVTKLYQESHFYVHSFPQLLNVVQPTRFSEVLSGGSCASSSSSSHIKLDQELVNFIDRPASLGTVIVAFGHLVIWTRAAPKRFTDIMVDALNNFTEYRVLWQHGDCSKLALKNHVRCMSWLPQVCLADDKSMNYT